MRDNHLTSQLTVDAIAELYWPIDPDRDGAEARGLAEYFRRADAMITPSDAELRELAASLPHTRRSIR